MVISIIALLIALLLPALQSAREMAKDSLCKNNMRSVGMFYHLYAADHDDEIVPLIDSAPSSPHGGGNINWGFGNPTTGDGMSRGFLSSYGTLGLRSEGKANVAGVTNDNYVQCPVYKTLYGSYAAHNGIGPRWGKAPWPAPSGSTYYYPSDNHFYDVGRPREVVLLGEGPNVGYGGWLINLNLGVSVATQLNGSSHLNTPHFGEIALGPSGDERWVDGNANYVWVDGHVESVGTDDNWLTWGSATVPGDWNLYIRISAEGEMWTP